MDKSLDIHLEGLECRIYKTKKDLFVDDTYLITGRYVYLSNISFKNDIGHIVLVKDNTYDIVTLNITDDYYNYIKSTDEYKYKLRFLESDAKEEDKNYLSFLVWIEDVFGFQGGLQAKFDECLGSNETLTKLYLNNMIIYKCYKISLLTAIFFLVNTLIKFVYIKYDFIIVICLALFHYTLCSESNTVYNKIYKETIEIFKLS